MLCPRDDCQPAEPAGASWRLLELCQWNSIRAGFVASEFAGRGNHPVLVHFAAALSALLVHINMEVFLVHVARVTSRLLPCFNVCDPLVLWRIQYSMVSAISSVL